MDGKFLELSWKTAVIQFKFYKKNHRFDKNIFGFSNIQHSALWVITKKHNYQMRPRQNCWQHFEIHFFEWKLLYFDLYFTEVYS